MDDLRSHIQQLLELLTKSTLLNEHHNSLALTTDAYVALDKLEKLLEVAKKSLRLDLLDEAEIQGAPAGKEGSVLSVGQEVVRRTARQKSAPDEAKLRALLETYSIPLTECFDEVKTMQLNPSRLQFLIDIGKLKAEEVDALRPVSYALTVTPGEDLAKLMAEACGESIPKSKSRRG